VFENEAKQKPRFLLCVLKKFREGLFQQTVSRESLYKTLSRRGNPQIDTIMELLRTPGLKLTVDRQKAA
jgi:hypothetical protein